MTGEAREVALAWDAYEMSISVFDCGICKRASLLYRLLHGPLTTTVWARSIESSTLMALELKVSLATGKWPFV